VFKLDIGNDLGISYKWHGFGLKGQRSTLGLGLAVIWHGFKFCEWLLVVTMASWSTWAMLKLFLWNKFISQPILYSYLMIAVAGKWIPVGTPVGSGSRNICDGCIAEWTEWSQSCLSFTRYGCVIYYKRWKGSCEWAVEAMRCHWTLL